MRRPEPRQELVVDAAKTAVAHHQHMVAGTRRLRDGLDEAAEINFSDRARAQ